MLRHCIQVWEYGTFQKHVLWGFLAPCIGYEITADTLQRVLVGHWAKFIKQHWLQWLAWRSWVWKKSEALQATPWCHFTARQLQDLHTCSSVSVWPRPKLPGWLYADSSPTPVSDDCVLPTLEHWSSVAPQFFWRQNIRCGSTSVLEQFAVWHKTTWLVLWSV